MQQYYNIVIEIGNKFEWLVSGYDQKGRTLTLAVLTAGHVIVKWQGIVFFIIVRTNNNNFCCCFRFRDLRKYKFLPDTS